MRHLLRTDKKTVEFYPVPSSVVFKHRLRVRDTLTVQPPLLPCLEGLVALQHDKYICPESATAMATNLRFDRCGNVTHLCPIFLRFLCTSYATAKWAARKIPLSVYRGRPLTLKTSYYPIVCKKVLVNTLNECKAKTHAIYGRGGAHPDSLYALGACVCEGCYKQLFEPDGWVDVDSLSRALEPAAYKSVIRPLRMVGLQHFLIGVVISHFQRQSLALDALKLLGRTYLRNPHDYLAKHFRDELQSLVYMTSPVIWRLFVDMQKNKYTPDVTTVVDLEYFGWAQTTNKLNKKVYGQPIRIAFEEEPSRTLYQTIVVNKTTNIVMHNDMYAWMSKPRRVTAVLADKDFELVDSIDARTWSGTPVADPVIVCCAEHITWSQLQKLNDRVVVLYGHLESAVRGVGTGVFAELVLSGSFPWTSSTALPQLDHFKSQHPSWTSHSFLSTLLTSTS